tara:strand:- start:454794 stop:455588 length:795 start_codon:yes stop_codon:yes gene_type:complete
MNRSDHDQFWTLYESKVRSSIERSCQHASRTLTDSTMDIDDMIAWIDTKVWKMLENDGYPTFHDNPTVERAIERLTTHAPTLARWSYLALCRKHFRRMSRTNQYITGMSQSQRLAATSAVDSQIEDRAELDEAIGSLRDALSANEKQKLAASWIEKSDRHRVAMVLGATRKEDDRMITKASGGGMNENAVQQMRSRARKRAAQILQDAAKLPFFVLATLVILTVSVASQDAIAGEQTGGRRGSMTASAVSDTTIPGEQTGGRQP